jgi:hypothetical protein
MVGDEVADRAGVVDLVVVADDRDGWGVRVGGQELLEQGEEVG